MHPKTTADKTIYWADDDSDDLEMFKAVLQELAPGFELIHFHNGKLLLEHLATLEDPDYPDLIVLDMNMPVLDGRATLTQLKKEKSYNLIPMVVFTTSTSNMDKLFCEWMHTEMLTKPFSYEELKGTLQKLLSYCRK